MENRDFDKDAPTWDENPGRVKLANNVANTIVEAIILNSAMNVLDFGCGTGLLTLQLQPLAGLITAVDSSPGMLQVLENKIKSQKLNNVQTKLLDIEQGDVLEGCYDLVVCSMTLHHIREIKPLIDQFYQIIAPQGYLCIADLDPDNGLFHGNNDGVFHFGFDRYTIEQTFKQSGFKQIQFRTATEIIRAIPGGARPFTVFLATGQK